MSKQSSKMYGIKVKRKINYCDCDDLRLSFDEDVWKITSLYDNVWFNGTQYHKDEEVLTFNDGEIVEYHVMAQYTDTTPYTNYMYDIVGNVAENSQYGNKEIKYKVITLENEENFKIRVIQYENGIIKAQKDFGTVEIMQYRNRYNKKYPVFNLLFDWHSTDPDYYQMSFECISNSSWIKYEGQQKDKGVTIKNWPGISSVDFDIVDETNKHQTDRVHKDSYPDVMVYKRKGRASIKSISRNRKTIYSDEYHVHKDAYYNGNYHNAMYLVYDNASLAIGCFHTLSKISGIALTWADPFWLLMTTQNGIEYNSRTYESKKLLKCWKSDVDVNMTLKSYKSRNKYKVDSKDYETIIYDLETNPDDGCLNIRMSETANSDRTTLFPSNTPSDFYNIQIKVEGNEWVIISKYGNIKYGDHTYGKNREVVRFGINEDVNIQLQDFNNKKKDQKEISTNYETTLYDIEMSENDSNVTVILQKMKESLDNSGKTVKNYTDLDTMTITPSDSPYTFHNIQFKLNSAQTVWTIISKCRYIQYNGRTYPLNRSIIDLPVNEDVHIQIKDETDKYEVVEELTYTVRTKQLENTYYHIHTSEIDKSLKIVKTNGETEEPWETVRFYDAEYENFVVDDIKFDFDNKTMTWALISNNDKLYSAGINYKKDSTIMEWGFNTIVKIDHVSVLRSDESGIEVKMVSSKKQIKGVDIDETLPPEVEGGDISLHHSSSKGVWKVISTNDDTWCNGIRYLSGETVLSFNDKVIVEPITIMVQVRIEGELVNRMYDVWSSFDVLNNVTTCYVYQHRGTTWSFDDKQDPGNVTMVCTKEQMKSMYGYIWKRDRGPGPTPPSQDPDIIIYVTYASYSSGSGVRGRLLGITNSANFTVQTLIDRTGSSSDYPSIRYAKGNRLYVNPLYYTDDFGHTAMKSFTPQFSPVYYRNGYPIDFNASETPTVDGTGAIILDKYKYAFLITGESLNYSDHLITYEIDLLGRLTRISDDLIYEAEDRPVNNLINQITSGNNNNFDYYFGAAFSKSGYRPDPYYGPILVSWTEYSILNKNFQSVADNPFDSVFGSLYNQYHIFDHYNPWIVDPQGNPIPVYEGVEFSQSQSISGYGWTDLKEQTQWHHYNQSNTQDEEDEIVPRTMYTTLGIMYNSFHLRRRYYEQAGPDSWRTLYQDLGYYYSIYDVNTGICSVNAYSYDYSDMQRALDIIERAKLFKGDAYSFEIVDDELHILQVSRSNPFIWQVVKSKDVGSTVNLKLYTNRSGSSTFVTITLGVNQLYNSSNRTCGIIPFDTSVGAVHSGSNGGAINTDNYWRYRVRIDGYQNKYINLVFDNPYFDGGGLGFAFLDDI